METDQLGAVKGLPSPPKSVSPATDWQGCLDGLLAEVEAPGAVLGILRGATCSVYASGMANLDTGQPMTRETLFPVASISKVYTSTLAMQLVDEGMLDLDRPIHELLPGFRVADRRATRGVTARHLLTHSSGLDGDKFDGFGPGDDAIARYVADCATLGQVHDVGATFSYCNSGMIILGRVVEVLRDITFDAALQQYVLDPLGATTSGMLPEDLIWRPLAAGHRLDDAGELSVFPQWENERAHGPAGGVVTNAEALMDFVRMHLDGGMAPNGTRLLSEQAAAAMIVPQVSVPNPHEEVTDWGLGWELARRPGQPLLVSHGGDLLAHHAWMVTCPEADVAMCLLVNGDGDDHVARPLLSRLLAEAGVTLYEPPSPPTERPDVDMSLVAGTYQTPAVQVRLTPVGAHLAGTFKVISELIAQMLPPAEREHHRELVPVTDTFYLMRPEDETSPWEPAMFYEAGGEKYLHVGLRAIRRTS